MTDTCKTSVQYRRLCIADNLHYISESIFYAGKTSTRGPKISDYFDVSITATSITGVSSFYCRFCCLPICFLCKVPGWKWFQSSQRPPISSPLSAELSLCPGLNREYFTNSRIPCHKDYWWVQLHMRWKWVSVLLQGLTECLCRSGRIAPHLRVCVLGNTIPKPPLASVSR